MRGGFEQKIPAITDFRAKGTIMGLAGLTAVFGMGTGVTPPVWSPEMYPAGGQARPGTGISDGWSHNAPQTLWQMNEWPLLHDILSNEPYGMARRSMVAVTSCRLIRQEDGSAPIGVVKLLGC
jgi:hypothetical protein